MAERAREGLALLLGALGALGAQGCARYTPQPLDVPARAAAFEARRLDDAALGAFIREHADSAGPPEGWDARHLALAALWFDPELDRARAAWQAAQADEIAAGWRPQPGLQAEAGRGTLGDVFESPWVASLAVPLPIELGGKRAARLARARAASAVAGVALREVAWRSVAGVREAALALARARALRAEQREEVAAAEAVVAALGRRVTEGSASSTELARLEQEVREARLALAAREGAVAQARLRLARSVAVLDDARLEALPLDAATGACDRPPAPDSARAAALQARLPLGAALARYAVAEAEVRVEVSRATPDLVLGPGIAYDQGILRWTILFAMPSLVTHRNRGPILAAEARRRAAAAEVDVAQQRVLGEVAAALAACEASARQVSAADSAVAGAERRLALVMAGEARGERGTLEVLAERLQRVRAG
ncbi:MAG: TolC family protein, partial [Gemmatimonadales bacterium]|nr:TolC family protein [Gemmatimonadales bacterium]